MVPLPFAMDCDACPAAQFASTASLPRPLQPCNLPFGRPEKQEWLPNQPGEPSETQINVSGSVRALRKEGHQHHQIR